MTTATWLIDPIQSYLHGLEVAGLGRGAADRSDGKGPWGTRELWAETVFVAICHATNWDKLHASIQDALESHPDLLEPTRLAELSPAEFELLTGLPDPRSSRDSQRRQAMLQQLGQEARVTGFIEYLDAFAPNGVELGGEGGTYAALSKLSAFSADPLQKKSRVLVHQWIAAGSLDVPDTEHVAPAVDYHLIRLYLRSNRIYTRSERSRERLLNGGAFNSAELRRVRKAVEEAMRYTATAAQLSIADLNHYEWQIARSFCLRSGARCRGPQLAEKPVDQVVEVLATHAGGCPLRLVCRGASEAKLRALTEPTSDAEFY